MRLENVDLRLTQLVQHLEIGPLEYLLLHVYLPFGEVEPESPPRSYLKFTNTTVSLVVGPPRYIVWLLRLAGNDDVLAAGHFRGRVLHEPSRGRA